MHQFSFPAKSYQPNIFRDVHKELKAIF